MKTVKPLKLGILHRTYLHEGQHTFTVTGFVFFDLRKGQSLYSEAGMWKAMAEELRDGEPLDEAMPKAKTDVLVSGYAFPQGGASIGCKVRVALGGVDKALYVVGDRHWGADGTPTDPEPFEKMPLSWARAFGGEGFADNPVGRGFAPVDEDGETIHRLPNVEHPKKLIQSKGDRPAPAGFGAIDVSWPLRAKKAGTYDQTWLETRFPGYAADIDWTFFNQAPLDQQLDGFLRGDEEVVFEGLHPTEASLEGRLPGVTMRCFINRAGEEIKLEEVHTRIDTVRFLPHLERGIAVFRGVIDVAEDDAHDIQQLICAVEKMGAPKPRSHYAQVLEQRLDKQRGAILALRDADLLPEGWAPPRAEDLAEEVSEHALLTRSDHLLTRNAHRGAVREAEVMRERMIAAGLEPTEVVDEYEPPEPLTVDQLADYVDVRLAKAEEEKKKAKAMSAEAEAKAREECERHGIDYDELVAARQKEVAGPPKYSADEELAKLQERARLFRNVGGADHDSEAKLADPELLTKLQRLEENLRMVYRMQVQTFPAAVVADGDEGAALSSRAKAALAAGEPFAERDFTGVPLPGEDLRQADLTRAWLEAADLRGADLRGVDLSHAVLARANLAGANLAGANLAGANLSEADLTEANVEDANLTEAVLVRAQLTRTVLTRALLTKANLLEARFAETILDEAKLGQAILLSLDLGGCSAKGADLTAASFVECRVAGADFARAILHQANFVTVEGAGANFAKATMTNARLVHGSDFAEASFAGANLEGANLRGTKLTKADFRQANLKASDLSECDLSEAQLDLATAIDALFIRSDLHLASATNLNAMNSILQKANLEGCDLRGANLFRADMAYIKGDQGTKLAGAHMKLIRFVDRPDAVKEG